MKHLVIISKGRNTWLTLYEQLTNLLGAHVKISGYYTDGNLPKAIEGDLILISSKVVFAEIYHLINEQSPVIIARRSINYHSLEKLFDIPDGTEVLLVNDSQSSTQETISLLLALGIDHIHYHPYAPGVRKYPHLRVAVTPGEPECVPPCVEHIVDIKTRTIDITTLVEVISKLSLPDVQANILSASYLSDIIHLIRVNKESAKISQSLTNKLHTIINTVHDGIIAVDETKRISVINPIAEQLLSLHSTQTINKSIDDILAANVKKAIVKAAKNQQEAFVDYNNKQLVINSAIIFDNDLPAGSVYTFKDVSEIQRLEKELTRKTGKGLHLAHYTLEQIMGNSPQIRSTIKTAYQMANSDSPILIQGESGTGKELLAQGIHNASPRKNGPFIAVNFAALTESLIESELFGYEEGSFTGARKGGATGLFEKAHKGTIFLDEIGDSPLTSQVNILRVLQEKQIRRIGSSRSIPIDVRVISATNQDVKSLIASGLFRKDLYYRLNVLPLTLPALRERGDDIFSLAAHFYESFQEILKAPLAPDNYFQFIKPYLLAYTWPGNIRELRNVVEYLMNISPLYPPTPDLLAEEMHQGLSVVEDFGCYAKGLSTEQLKTIILQEVANCNQQRLSVGRRSLAASLNIPENIIRKLLTELQNSGQIIVYKGRKGLYVPVVNRRQKK